MNSAERFDSFTNLPTSANIRNNFVREYSPIATLANSSLIEFSIPPSGALFVDLPRTRLQVKLSVTDADGKAVDSTKKTAPIANVLGSIFQNVDVSLNGVQMNIPESQNAPFRNYVHQLLTRDQAYANSLGEVEGLCLDSARYTDANDVTESSNSGLRRRWQAIGSTGSVTLSGYLTQDIFCVKKLLPGSLGLNVRLYPVRNEFLLMVEESDTTAYKYHIDKAYLYVSYVEPSDEVFVAFNQALKQRPALFEIPRNDLKSYVLAAGSNTFTVDNCLSNGRPDTVLVYFILNKSYAGDYNHSPYHLAHHNINFCTLSYEGQIVNNFTFQPSFTNDTAAKPDFDQGFMDAYSSLYHKDGNESTGNLITPLMYRCGFFILRWDLHEDVHRAHVDQETKTGLTRISFRFDSALKDTLTCIVHSITKGHFAIDSAHNVILEPTSIMQL